MKKAILVCGNPNSGKTSSIQEFLRKFIINSSYYRVLYPVPLIPNNIIADHGFLIAESTVDQKIFVFMKDCDGAKELEKAFKDLEGTLLNLHINEWDFFIGTRRLENSSTRNKVVDVIDNYLRRNLAVRKYIQTNRRIDTLGKIITGTALEEHYSNLADEIWNSLFYII